MSSAVAASQATYGLPEFPLTLERDPPSPVKIREWVAELFEQNHLSLAIALAEAGLALYPANEDVLVIAALVAEVQQDWAHSRELLEQLIKVQSGNTPAEVWHHLARVMRCDGQHPEALRVARRALLQHPLSADLQRMVNELLEAYPELAPHTQTQARA
jgi:tetratricopeptide (TPR) repeat protein